MNPFKVSQRISNGGGTRSRIHGCRIKDKSLFEHS